MKVNLIVGPRTSKINVGRLKGGLCIVITKGAQTSIRNIVWLKIAVLNIKWKYPFFHHIQSEQFITTDVVENCLKETTLK